jgi:peptidoglycan/LPS O-acetylase OafA/YrhL
MFTIRNLGGVALFLFGTTYLWLTPMFAGRGTPTKGILWSITQVLAFVTLLGFMIATWGLFKKTGWWDGVAITTAVIGLVVLIPYWIAAHSSGEPTPWWNVLVHAVGAVGVLVLLTVPALGTWVDGHVMAGN